MKKIEQFRLKLFLVLVGLTMGLVCFVVATEVFSRVLNKLQHGKSFENLADLRASMFEEKKEADGSVSFSSIINPHPDDRIIYDLRPNIDVIFQQVPVHTNSCGMRNREVSIPKGDDVYRIALLGDSFAFGWGVREEQSFAQVMERALNREAAGKRKVEVLNFGVPGYSTFQEVYKFLETGADFNVDAILVYFISNDFGYPFMVRDVSRPGKLLSNLEFARLTYQAMHPDVEQQKMFLQGLDPNTALTRLSDYARERAIPLAVAINPYKKWSKEKWRVPIFDKRKDVTLIEMRDPMNEAIAARGIPVDQLKLPTDPHPSAIKHEIIGEVLASYYLRYFN